MKDLESIHLPGMKSSDPIIIAGPCSAETRKQTLTTATQLAANGIKVFRAGIWKPRTKPGGFEGVGANGLAWLKEVKNITGMYVATEVANRTHVEAALDSGIDMIWIGARTSANPFAIQEIADTLQKRKANLPVLVKNPINPDLELWIGSLQRIYNAGIRKLGAIHRGFSTYGKHIYRNVPQWHIPIELRLRFPELPIICDPSHIGGRRELIAPLSQEAFDMGFNGLIVESHCDPDCAWSDAAQQLTPEILNFILNTLVIRDSKQSTENLALLRQQIDRIDNELIEVLSRRMQVSRDIGCYKKEHRMPVVQAARYNDVIKTRLSMGAEMELGEGFLKTVFLAIHDESVRQQIEIISDRKKR